MKYWLWWCTGRNWEICHQFIEGFQIVGDRLHLISSALPVLKSLSSFNYNMLFIFFQYQVSNPRLYTSKEYFTAEPHFWLLWVVYLLISGESNSSILLSYDTSLNGHYLKIVNNYQNISKQLDTFLSIFFRKK